MFPRAPFSTASATSTCVLRMYNTWSDLFLSMEVSTLFRSVASTTSCTNRKQLKPLTSHFNYMHDTNTASSCVRISTCMPTRPTLMTAPADNYVKNAASTLSVLGGEYTESVLECVHEVLVSCASPYPLHYCCCPIMEGIVQQQYRAEGKGWRARLMRCIHCHR